MQRKQSKQIAGVLAAGLLASLAVLPAQAEDKMSKMDGKMAPAPSKMPDKMAMDKMMSMMTPAEKKTMAGMSPAEKALMMKMVMHAQSGHMTMDKMGGAKMGGVMGGAKMGTEKMAMTCPHCGVKMVNGKCPMCGMTAEQMKNDKMDDKKGKM